MLHIPNVFLLCVCVCFSGITNEGKLAKCKLNKIVESDHSKQEQCKFDEGDIIKVCWKLKNKKNKKECQIIDFYKNQMKLNIVKKINYDTQKDCHCLCVMYYGYNNPIEFLDEKVYF